MKKGFTLIELLAVIAIMAIIMLIAFPQAIKFLNIGKGSVMSVQESEIKDAALLYLEDFCKSPIDSSKSCTLTKEYIDDVLKFSGEISLDTLVAEKYISNVTYRGNECDATITFNRNVPSVKLICKDASNNILYETK